MQVVRQLTEIRSNPVTSEQRQANAEWNGLGLIDKLMQLHDNPFMLEEILSKAPEGCPTMAFLDGKPKLPPAGQVLPIGMRYNFSTFRV